MVHPADPAEGRQSGYPDEPGDEAGLREANGFARSVDLLIGKASCSDGANATTPTASCLIDRARVCAGPNAFPSVTGRTRARRVGLGPSSRRSEQTWWVRRDRRRDE